MGEFRMGNHETLAAKRKRGKKFAGTHQLQIDDNKIRHTKSFDIIITF